MVAVIELDKLFLSFAMAFLLAVLTGAGFAPTAGYAESKSHTDKNGTSSESEAHENGGKKETGGAFYVHLKPLVLPVVGADGAEQIITLIIALQVKDEKAAQKTREMMPKIQDAIFSALYGGLGDGSLRKGQTVDIPRVKKKITAALGEIMDKEIVSNVLIQAVAQRTL